MKEVNLKISHDDIKIDFTLEDGIKTYRRCDVDELLNLIKGSISTKKCVTINSGIINGNIDILEMFMIYNPGEGKMNKGYFVYVKEAPLAFNYYNKIYPFSKFPALLFYFEVSDCGRIVQSKVFVVLEDRKSIAGNTQIYVYPFGNVDSQGKICYGTNNLPVVDGVSDLQGAIDVFLFSPTNDDYVYPNNKYLFEGPQSILLRDLIDKKVTFNDILLPYCSYNILKDKIKSGYRF